MIQFTETQAVSLRKSGDRIGLFGSHLFGFHLSPGWHENHMACSLFSLLLYSKTPDKSNLRREVFGGLTAGGYNPSEWGRHGNGSLRQLVTGHPY